MSAISVEPRRERSLEAILWLTAIVVGALQAWAGRYAVGSDGISYLDMGDAYLRGDWQMAVNAYWSPLYSWLLGAMMLLLKPSPYWEFPATHLLNFLIYLGALFSFSFFLHELMRYQQQRAPDAGAERYMMLPRWSWIVIGYTLFIWSSL
ncbi:MAG TPA: hypothetical protein VD966_09000, partial [Pyrinomonadaceae bacterium]|nr:hypothetical protein [Pyrinomonadaceae bacterium]